MAAPIELAADPVSSTRRATLGTLADSGTDTAEVHAVLADQLTDPHPAARVQAAAGLALPDDPRGREALYRLETDPAAAQPAREWLDQLDSIRARRPAR